ncbi:MAG TPA: isovaleryl-CoA dehydrogenase [Alphaproteobacteria bacterium]|jgi:putative acyl-CoA dehydrogenase|nr:isovaleryl-CoA dehydrogenase [Alphaproteobacteria bacterium]
MGETHSVTNQPPPLADYDLFSTDPALTGAVAAEGGGWAADGLKAFGARLGEAGTLALGELANRNSPILHTFDRFGHRIDEVEFHPAWHELLTLAVGQGLHSAPWAEPKPGAHVARAAGVYLMCQVEAGVQCPVTMTYGAVPALKRQPEIATEWLPRIYSRAYDRRFCPGPDKAGALIGMGMTEKQGGSDLRANQTRAEPVAARGAAQPYRLTGHKWFLSAPMCDAFLVLAQAEAGPTCFFLPRWTPDGERNAIRIQRLKDKLGNRSNASSEVEFDSALGWAVGDEGRGIPTIIEMANYTRLDCALGTSGLMRQAVAQAAHHASYRTAFQKKLIDQPLMRNVVADLAIEAEAAMRLALRLARAYDRPDDPSEAAFARLVTPAAKYWICKRGPMLAAEAMEVLGGNGYVEEGPMPRLYREMPVNSIWEGSGNIMCLDVLRAAGRSPDSLDAAMAELKSAAGADHRFDAFCTRLADDFAGQAPHEGEARRIVERLVLALQGALLLKHAQPAVADAFCDSRLGGDHGGAFGTLLASVDADRIARAAAPLGAS